MILFPYNLQIQHLVSGGFIDDYDPTLPSLPARFIGTGIQYCFTRNLHGYSTNFYFSYFLRVFTGALACIFICLTVNHFGRRGILLLSAIITGLSSLLLLALTQCKLHVKISFDFYKPFPSLFEPSSPPWSNRLSFTLRFVRQNESKAKKPTGRYRTQITKVMTVIIFWKCDKYGLRFIFDRWHIVSIVQHVHWKGSMKTVMWQMFFLTHSWLLASQLNTSLVV